MLQCGDFPASSSTRSRRWSEATGSRSAHASATIRVMQSRASWATGRLIEYWAHEACLLPAEDWPRLRPSMQDGGRRWYGEVDRTHPHLREHILAEIRSRGALGSRHFDGAARQGEMWGWKPAKQMLELLWNHGELVVAGRQGFQRLYDLPERVLPRAVLEAPTPPEPERLRDLALRAVEARGALTESGIVEHWRLRGGAARVRDAVEGLVADGVLERLQPDDGGQPVIVPAGAGLDPPAPSAAVLLSPFDNLLWDRSFARRVLGFDHVIEVYKPAPERRFGYYVLPLLWRDRIVGRADLKSERARGRTGGPGVPHRARRTGLERSRRRPRPRAGAAAARGRAREGGARVIELSLHEARRMAVAAQLLDGSAPASVTEVVRALGSVQVDPVSAVARAERMVLFSRLGPYDVADLDAALQRGELYEYWAHIVPASDYGIHRESMRRYPSGDGARARYIREWLAANAAFRRYVLRELRRRGPLLSRDLEDRSAVQWRTGGWNDGKGLGRMLDILWFRGEIAIVRREGNERVWDLAARRLPQNEPRWRAQEVARAVVERGLRRKGIARRDEFGRTFGGVPPGADRAFRVARARGDRRPARVSGLDGEWWAHRDVLDRPPLSSGQCCFRPSTGSSTTVSVRRSFSASVIGSRCTFRRPSGSTATTFFPVLRGTTLIGRVDATFDRRRERSPRRAVWAERGHRLTPVRCCRRVARARDLAWRRTTFASAGVSRAHGRERSVPESAGPAAGAGLRLEGRLVDEAAARRIAVRSQLLDGSASGVLETVRHLGFLQLDPIATVGARPAPRALEQARRVRRRRARPLLWEERALFEWDALLWPTRRCRWCGAHAAVADGRTGTTAERWVRGFVAENAAFRRYVLRELERRGPLLSRELEDRSRRKGVERHAGTARGTSD